MADVSCHARVSSTVASTEDVFNDGLQYAAAKLQINEFKPLQREAIKGALLGRDVCVSLPTGYGKSCIFHALPLCFDWLRRAQHASQATVCPPSPTTSPVDVVHPSVPSTSSFVVVISPLVSLMKNQVETLRERGVDAVHFGEASPEEDQRLRDGKVSHIFMSPESVFERGFQLFQSQKWQENLCAIAVDESHCVVKW